MTYLVLAYPHFAHADLAWIEAIRTAHDPQVALVAPHVTLLFPIAEDAVALNKMVAHVDALALTTSSIVLTLRCALVMPETGRPGAHLFLAPDEGMSDLVKLHDRLYSGSFASHLRLEFPFIPHLTVGAGNDPAALYQVAQELNNGAFALSASIDQLTVVRHAAGVVTTVGEAKLGGPPL